MLLKFNWWTGEPGGMEIHINPLLVTSIYPTKNSAYGSAVIATGSEKYLVTESFEEVFERILGALKSPLKVITQREIVETL